MKSRLHYLLVPGFYAMVMLAGRMSTSAAVGDWYPSLAKPPYTPPGELIGAVWTLIYVLASVSFIAFVNRGRGSKVFLPITFLYVLNGVLNAAWSYLFFARRMIGLAAVDAAMIALTVAALMVFLWPVSRLSSALLLPYLGWVSFATYLNYSIYSLN